jgi:tripartite ATP-independent transporter DctM subunit
MIGVVIVVLFTLLGLSLPVAAALFILGLFLNWWYVPSNLLVALDLVLWRESTSFILVAIPLFILLGEILLRSGIAERVYGALDSWLSWLPGGLMHANIATSMMFSATSGSSVATAATVGTIALPQAKKLGYDERLFTGSIAAGGTLGILIPPSINLIIYGFLTQSSIPGLFLAGILPGIGLALVFSIIILILCLVKPQLAGRRVVRPQESKLKGLVHLIPILLLFLVVVGSIYAGWATPTEAAALGVLFALLLAVAYRRLSMRMLRESLEGTMRSTAMIMLILLAANFLNFVFARMGMTRQLTSFLEGLNITSLQTLLVIILFYIVLGFFVETLSLMVITIPIVTPVVFSLGYDPVWFGIMLILLIEMALITPPVGLNLYVVQGVRGHGSMSDVMIGAVPFVLAMLIMLGLLIVFPQIALFLPNLSN